MSVRSLTTETREAAEDQPGFAEQRQAAAAGLEDRQPTADFSSVHSTRDHHARQALQDLERRSLELERRELEIERRHLALERSALAARISTYGPGTSGFEIGGRVTSLRPVSAVHYMPGGSQPQSLAERWVPPIVTGASAPQPVTRAQPVGHQNYTYSLAPPVLTSTQAPSMMASAPSPSRSMTPVDQLTRAMADPDVKQTPAASSMAGAPLMQTLNESQIAARRGTGRGSALPIFTGDPEEWSIFIASYESSTALCGYTREENMLRVQWALKGKALEAVRHRLLLPECLDGAMEMLRALFGRPEIVVNTLVRKIRKMSAPVSERPETIVDFGVAVLNMCATIKATGLDDFQCNATLLQEIVEKLPLTERMRWNDHRLDLPRTTFAEFEHWLDRLVRASSLSVTYHGARTERSNRHGQVSRLNTHTIVPAAPAPHSKHSTAQHQATCTVCHEPGHKLIHCRQFTAMDVERRWLTVKDRRLCRQCLGRHPGVCRLKKSCGKNGCQAMHHDLLHEDVTEAAPIRKLSCNAHATEGCEVLFRYVPVMVHGNGRSIQTYAFFDDGSSATFVEQGLIDELGLKGTPNPLCIQWTGDTGREEKNSVRLSLTVSGVNEQQPSYVIPKAHTLRKLALPKQSVSASELAQRYPHLKGIPIASFENARPRLLIGIDNSTLGQALRCAEGKNNEPIAAKTRLGWTVYGTCQGAQKASVVSMYHHAHTCTCSMDRDNALDVAVRQFFTIESLGVSSRVIHSKENERALRILATETQLKGTRYETGLLWKYDDVRLPNNRSMALKRHLCLRRKMDKEPKLAQQMSNKINDYLTKGYLRRVSDAELSQAGPRDWYLPIFPVTNVNKPGKIRIVFDAAAEVQGVSLNSYLLAGPDQLTNILAVLFKFREFRVAVVGDIREMFHQVMMKREDQRSQLIMWDDAGMNLNGPPSVYAVTVMTFGAACSPSCAQYVKNINAERYSREYPRAVECIVNEHYVDDLLCSVETEKEAVDLAEQVKYIHAQGGFEIRNWLSNSKAVVTRLAPSESSALSEKDMQTESGTEKVLGMWWDTSTDQFTFRLSPKHDAELLTGARLPTKREVLRTLMSIYDPIGLLGNYLSYLKILLQETWRAGLGWDEPISGSIADNWKRWIRTLPAVQRVSVPRCYRNNVSIHSSNIQLHVFCDASESAMAAVAYFRFEDGRNIECAFVGSKTRVTPLNFQSIPRLELQAAVIGSRLANSIIKSHRITLSRVCYWTDSRYVICWLRSDHRRFSQYVAFRIGEIVESTSVNDWRWISTKINIADEGTKWHGVPNLDPSSTWFRGPTFLWGPEDDWPASESRVGETTEELRHTVMHHLVQAPLIGFDRFSEWRLLLRTVGYVLRFVSNMQLHAKKKPRDNGHLTQEELLKAERVILRAVQRQAYPTETRGLQDAGTDQQARTECLKGGQLYQLLPEIDAHGVMRARSRLNSCPWVDENTKRPIILPRGHHATMLLLRHYHLRYHHLNHQTAINQVRAKYHVPRLRTEFNRVRSSCQHCKNRDATPEAPLMSDVPEVRLGVYRRPFTFTGVDFFGPIVVSVGRRTEKRWGVLFTCLTTRAIHLEVAHSLSTSSCILAIRRFMNRRGTPAEIVSDCGTNFVGASRELREAWEQVDQRALCEQLTAPEL